MFWQALELVEYVCKAGLLLYLLHNVIMVKDKYKKAGAFCLFLQVYVINFWLSNSRWLDEKLYGETRNSSYSIIKQAIGFCICFLALDFLYQGRRLAKLYLLFVFYTVQETARFAIHSVWLLFVMGYLDRLGEQIMAGDMELEVYYRLLERLQIAGWVLFTGGYLGIMYLTLWMYRKYLKEPVTQTTSQGFLFLMLAPIIGVALDVTLRIIFYRQEGVEIESLYERHNSMYAMVPVISVLCLVSEVYSRKIYSE